MTVRLINVKDGRPLTNQSVEYLGGPHIMATTSADGTAIFHPPNPMPDKIIISAQYFGSLHRCGSAVFQPSEIIETGVVAGNECDPHGKLAGKFKAKPGEVIIFA